MYGYCRKMEHDFKITIPREIKAVIHSFGKFYFKWKHGSDGGQYKFEGNSMKIKYTKHSRWSILALNDYVLSLKQGDKFEWEIKIVKTTSFVFSMGFVSYPINASIKDWNAHLRQDSTTRNKQWGIYVFNQSNKVQFFDENGFLQEVVVNKTGSILKKATATKVKFHSGSRFRLVFDFKKRKCSVYHDDEFCGVFADDIPEKVIPTISFYWTASAICTKFGSF